MRSTRLVAVVVLAGVSTFGARVAKAESSGRRAQAASPAPSPSPGPEEDVTRGGHAVPDVVLEIDAADRPTRVAQPRPASADGVSPDQGRAAAVSHVLAAHARFPRRADGPAVVAAGLDRLFRGQRRARVVEAPGVSRPQRRVHRGPRSEIPPGKHGLQPGRPAARARRSGPPSGRRIGGQAADLGALRRDPSPVRVRRQVPLRGDRLVPPHDPRQHPGRPAELDVERQPGGQGRRVRRLPGRVDRRRAAPEAGGRRGGAPGDLSARRPGVVLHRVARRSPALQRVVRLRPISWRSRGRSNTTRATRG